MKPTILYNQHILPILMNASMNSKMFRQQRQKVVSWAQGDILELGIGSGTNLPYYDASKVNIILGLDCCDKSLRYAKKQAHKVPFPVELLQGTGENIPLANQSVDMVVSTFTLCTVPSPITVLHNIQKVLKPNGKFIFCEHGQAPDAKVQCWQNILNPLNQKFAGGCNLNRKIDQLIEQSGFHFDCLYSSYFSQPKFLTFTYWGQCSIGN